MITVQFPNASQVLVKSKLLRVLLEKMPWDRWLIIIKLRFKINAYCWWKKSFTSWYVVHPIIYKVLYIPGGFLAGFLNQQYVTRSLPGFSRWVGGVNSINSSGWVHSAVVRLTCTSMARCMCTLGGVTVSWMRFGHVSRVDLPILWGTVFRLGLIDEPFQEWRCFLTFVVYILVKHTLDSHWIHRAIVQYHLIVLSPLTCAGSVFGHTLR